MNAQIIDISCLCMICETPITKMVLSTRIKNLVLNTKELHNIATCYNCHLDRLVSKRKGIK
jgi:hypothetical protein